MKKFFDSIFNGNNFEETRIEHHLPYEHHIDDTTVLLKNGAMMKVIKLEGFSFETADDEDIDIRKNIRNNLFKSIASSDYKFTFHVIRRRDKSANQENNQVMSSQFATEMNSVWNRKNMYTKVYINEIYVSIVSSNEKKGVEFIFDLYKKLTANIDTEAYEFDIQTLYDSITDVSRRILNSLNDYAPRQLSLRETRHGISSEIGEFLNGLVNLDFWGKPYLVGDTSLSRSLPKSSIYTGKKHIEIRHPNGSKFANVISAKEYPAHTSASILDALLQSPSEFVLSQSFEYTPKTTAINSMQVQKRKLISAGDKAISNIIEISDALDMVTSGQVEFGKHSLSLVCFADNLHILSDTTTSLVNDLSNMSFRVVHETTNMLSAYFGMFPGNDLYIARKANISSMNLSGFVSFHNYPSGKRSNNHWGEYVTILDTISRTVFYFNFHVRDVGHTMIVGPTGAGKTVLMNFLCAQLQKFSCRMFYFDKDHGAEIFIRSINGNHRNIKTNESCGFNPLQIADTQENRAYLNEFLRILLTPNDEVISAEDNEVINFAIDGNYKLDFADRKLSNIAPFFGLKGNNSLASRLSPWFGEGSYASVFDNDLDTINFEDSPTYGFEMSNLLNAPYILTAVLSYIFHRIQISLDGQPTVIVLDEAWALIDNPYFAYKLKDWLKVLRKLNAFVIFATQSVEDALSSSISDTLVQQTATQIFLPNMKATPLYQSKFMLSTKEYDLIKGIDPGSRFFVLKQGMQSVIARLDLNGFDKFINVLSGRNDSVILMHQIMKDVNSEHPKDWLHLFYERVGQL